MSFLGGSQKGCFSDDSENVSNKRIKKDDTKEFGLNPLDQNDLGPAKPLNESSLRKISDQYSDEEAVSD